jgi:tRNA/rRNA methyltransferase
MLSWASIRQCFSWQTRFILVATHHAGNIGAAARAIKTMGFDELVLVNPRDPKVLRRERTKQAASGAMNVMEGCKIYDNLEQALDGMAVSCGTGMPHDMSRTRQGQLYTEPRPFLYKILLDKNSNQSIAFVFGNEKMGMSSDDMSRCDVILGIPTNPQFGSLNLASAVQLIAYDWRQALGGFRNEDTMD